MQLLTSILQVVAILLYLGATVFHVFFFLPGGGAKWKTNSGSAAGHIFAVFAYFLLFLDPQEVWVRAWFFAILGLANLVYAFVSLDFFRVDTWSMAMITLTTAGVQALRVFIVVINTGAWNIVPWGALLIILFFTFFSKGSVLIWRHRINEEGILLVIYSLVGEFLFLLGLMFGPSILRVVPVWGELIFYIAGGLVGHIWAGVSTMWWNNLSFDLYTFPWIAKYYKYDKEVKQDGLTQSIADLLRKQQQNKKPQV